MKRKKAAVWVTMVAAMVLVVSACGKQSVDGGFPSAGWGQNSAAPYGEGNPQEESRHTNGKRPGKQQPENPGDKGNQGDKGNPGDKGNQGDKETQELGINKFDEFDSQADLEGSVYDFTETGFSLSPAETYEDGDGSVMAQAAPGAEDASKLVTITYSEDCVFQIVVMDLSSLKEVSREDTTSESIKKQTQVKVYGNCQDTTHWTAEGILIVRWQ